MKSQVIVWSAIVLGLAGTAQAASDAQKCQAAKLSVVSKFGACRLNTAKKAVLKSTTAVYTKCDGKYATAWPKMESKYGLSCPTSGDLMPVKTDLTKFTDCMAAKLKGDSVGSCFPGLPATGQTGVYVANDDGGVQAGGELEYVDNADGTITDVNTGLMWEKKVKRDSIPDAANLQDSDNCYPWHGSCTVGGAACGIDSDCGPNGPCTSGDCLTPSPNGLTIFEWVAAVNAAGFAGYSDWRIPNIKELISIIDFGSTTNPAIHPAFNDVSCGGGCTAITDPDCSCTTNYCYWSSTTVHGQAPPAAWDGFFYGGCGQAYPKTQALYVRAVRGGSD